MKVSIIIATYNVANCIHISLDSILNQTFEDWECIVVDGASKDDTVSIVRNYCEKDLRICCVSEPDDGIYDAFNKGWKLAKGEYVYYLGADDYVLPNAFMSVFSEKQDKDIIYGNIYFETTKEVRHITYSSNPSLLLRGSFSHQATFMKRSAICAMKGFDTKYKIVADYDLLLRALLSNLSFHHVDIDIAHFMAIDGVSSKQNVFFTESYYVRKNNKTIPFSENLLLSLKIWLSKKRIVKWILRNT